MSKTQLTQLLSNQNLILYYSESNLDLINVIINGWDKAKPVFVDNSFLHNAAFSFYRSVIIDLYCLYGPANSSNKNSLFYLFKFGVNFLNPSVLDDIQLRLSNQSANISVIKDLRHKQLAHYDFTKRSAISVNFNRLHIVNELHKTAKEIMTFAGHGWIDPSDNIGFVSDTLSEYMQDLEALIDASSLSKK